MKIIANFKGAHCSKSVSIYTDSSDRLQLEVFDGGNRACTTLDKEECSCLIEYLQAYINGNITANIKTALNARDSISIIRTLTDVKNELAEIIKEDESNGNNQES